jgi:DNA-directed RNA polymerase subunit M/transcription elongation factor TFIIS
MIDNSFRDNIFKEISKYLGNSVSKDVEEGIYKFSIEYAENNGTPFLSEQIYKTKGDEIIKILEGKTLQFIITSIKNNKINPKKIAYMRKSELVPILDNDKNKLKIKGSDIFECKKCKKRNVLIDEKQTRAADEPATQFITCLECGNTWTIG